MLSNSGVGQDSWESLGLQGDEIHQSQRKSTLNIHWKDWCWSWSSNTLASWWEKPTDWKRPWGWERLMAGGEGDDRGGDGWLASSTRRTWVWVSSRRWWWTGRPGMLQSMGLKRVRSDWTTEQQQQNLPSPHKYWLLFLPVALQYLFFPSCASYLTSAQALANILFTYPQKLCIIWTNHFQSWHYFPCQFKLVSMEPGLHLTFRVIKCSPIMILLAPWLFRKYRPFPVEL